MLLVVSSFLMYFDTTIECEITKLALKMLKNIYYGYYKLTISKAIHFNAFTHVYAYFNLVIIKIDVLYIEKVLERSHTAC